MAAQYGGMNVRLMARMKELDEENKHLKTVFAEKSIQNDLLKDALGKVWRGHPCASRWRNGSPRTAVIHLDTDFLSARFPAFGTVSGYRGTTV